VRWAPGSGVTAQWTLAGLGPGPANAWACGGSGAVGWRRGEEGGGAGGGSGGSDGASPAALGGGAVAAAAAAAAEEALLSKWRKQLTGNRPKQAQLQRSGGGGSSSSSSSSSADFSGGGGGTEGDTGSEINGSNSSNVIGAGESGADCGGGSDANGGGGIGGGGGGQGVSGGVSAVEALLKIVPHLRSPKAAKCAKALALLEHLVCVSLPPDGDPLKASGGGSTGGGAAHRSVGLPSGASNPAASSTSTNGASCGASASNPDPFFEAILVTLGEPRRCHDLSLRAAYSSLFFAVGQRLGNFRPPQRPALALACVACHVFNAVDNTVAPPSTSSSLGAASPGAASSVASALPPPQQQPAQQGGTPAGAGLTAATFAGLAAFLASMLGRIDAATSASTRAGGVAAAEPQAALLQGGGEQLFRARLFDVLAFVYASSRQPWFNAVGCGGAALGCLDAACGLPLGWWAAGGAGGRAQRQQVATWASTLHARR